MDSPYASTDFYHFVGHSSPDDDEKNFETLLKVLRAECVSHRPYENDWGTTSYQVNWEKSILHEMLLVPTVTCYADIPFNSLWIHTRKYGRFGLSFDRELMIKYGARPVIYVPMRRDDWQSPYGTTFLKGVEAAYKGIYEHVISKFPSEQGVISRSVTAPPADEKEAVEQVIKIFEKDFLAYIKPYNSHLDINHPHNFYMEREWRKYGNLKFEPDQVKKVVVAKGFSRRLETLFPLYKEKIEEIS